MLNITGTEKVLSENMKNFIEGKEKELEDDMKYFWRLNSYKSDIQILHTGPVSKAYKNRGTEFSKKIIHYHLDLCSSTLEKEEYVNLFNPEIIEINSKQYIKLPIVENNNAIKSM